jgi:Nitrile hydratase, alpha chain
MSTTTATVNSIGAIIAQAMRNADFRSQLRRNPKQVLLAQGVPLPESQAVTVLESDHHQSYFVLPIMTAATVQELKDSLTSVHPNRLGRSRILIKVAEDPIYKQLLLQDPQSVLRAAGVTITPGHTNITVLENTVDQLYVIIPATPHQH